MAKGLVTTMRSTMKALQGFPENGNRALKQVADNDLRMTVRPSGVDPIMARIEQAVDLLAFALVVSSFVIGFSWLLARTQIPRWLELIADLTLVGAACVGFAFFLSILFRRFRQRRRD